jgi:hypothetical protein
MNRRHPLPWSIHNGALRLGGQSPFGDEDEPNSLALGRNGSGMEAPLTADQLRQIRDQIDAILTAPFRVLLPNPCEHDEPWLPTAIRERLYRHHAAHPQFEIAMLDMDALADEPMGWSTEAQVRVLHLRTVEQLFAEGGNVVLLVAGPGALELSRQARDVGLPVQLIRRPEAVAS